MSSTRPSTLYQGNYHLRYSFFLSIKRLFYKNSIRDSVRVYTWLYSIVLLRRPYGFSSNYEPGLLTWDEITVPTLNTAALVCSRIRARTEVLVWYCTAPCISIDCLLSGQIKYKLVNLHETFIVCFKCNLRRSARAFIITQVTEAKCIVTVQHGFSAKKTLQNSRMYQYFNAVKHQYFTSTTDTLGACFRSCQDELHR